MPAPIKSDPSSTKGKTLSVKYINPIFAFITPHSHVVNPSSLNNEIFKKIAFARYFSDPTFLPLMDPEDPEVPEGHQ